MTIVWDLYGTKRSLLNILYSFVVSHSESFHLLLCYRNSACLKIMVMKSAFNQRLRRNCFILLQTASLHMLTNTSVEQTPLNDKQLLLVPVCHFSVVIILLDLNFIKDGHLLKTDSWCMSRWCPSWRQLTVNCRYGPEQI